MSYKPLGAEPDSRAGFGLGGFLFAIAGQGGGFKRAEKPIRNGSDFVDSFQKGCFVGLGGLVESADLSHELQRSSVDFFFGDRWIEVEKSFDVSAHGESILNLLSHLCHSERFSGGVLVWRRISLRTLRSFAFLAVKVFCLYFLVENL